MELNERNMAILNVIRGLNAEKRRFLRSPSGELYDALWEQGVVYIDDTDDLLPRDEQRDEKNNCWATHSRDRRIPYGQWLADRLLGSKERKLHLEILDEYEAGVESDTGKAKQIGKLDLDVLFAPEHRLGRGAFNPDGIKVLFQTCVPLESDRKKLDEGGLGFVWATPKIKHFAKFPDIGDSFTLRRMLEALELMSQYPEYVILIGDEEGEFVMLDRMPEGQYAPAPESKNACEYFTLHTSLVPVPEKPGKGLVAIKYNWKESMLGGGQDGEGCDDDDCYDDDEE